MKTRKETVLKSDVREWHVKRALESMVALADVAMGLTLDEVIHCLNLEATTRRRKSIITTLIRHAARIEKQQYIEYLKLTYLQPHERK